mgnify:CR=1 FL=1
MQDDGAANPQPLPSGAEGRCETSEHGVQRSHRYPCSVNSAEQLALISPYYKERARQQTLSLTLGEAATCVGKAGQRQTSGIC